MVDLCQGGAAARTRFAPRARRCREGRGVNESAATVVWGCLRAAVARQQVPGPHRHGPHHARRRRALLLPAVPWCEDAALCGVRAARILHQWAAGAAQVSRDSRFWRRGRGRSSSSPIRASRPHLLRNWSSFRTFGSSLCSTTWTRPLTQKQGRLMRALAPRASRCALRPRRAPLGVPGGAPAPGFASAGALLTCVPPRSPRCRRRGLVARGWASSPHARRTGPTRSASPWLAWTSSTSRRSGSTFQALTSWTGPPCWT